MAIRLPPLHPACVRAIFCGTVKSEDTRVKKWLEKEQMMVVRTSIAGRPFVVRVITGDSFEGHFHIDLADLEYYGRDEAPEKTHTLPKLRAELAILQGERCETDFQGMFVAPLSWLPDVVQGYLRVAVTPTILGGVRVRSTGGTLRVEGAPIRTMRWRDMDLVGSSDEEKGIVIDLEGTKEVVIDDDYLVNLWQLVQSTFSKLISREPPRVRPEA